METGFDLATVRDFAVAILIGALCGLEREKRRESEAGPTIGGLRTFLLIALSGAASAWLSRVQGTPWIFIATLAAVAAVVFAGYVLAARVRADSLGLTTEVAALAVFLLAGMVLFGYLNLAVGLGIVTAAALAYKQPLHGLVGRVGWDELFAVLRLLIASFIVLPLLPDRTIDPLGALNPYSLWLLVILISALSFAGYVATRLLGEGRGIPLTGLTGGLVSSTAVTLSFARRGKEQGTARASGALAAGILLAWGVMFVRVVVEVLVVEPALVARILLPFGAMAVAAAGAAWWMIPRGGPAELSEEPVALRNPFRLVEAVRFAALFALVLVVVKLAERYFPGQGLYTVAALAGLTDVDAITLSMAQYAGRTGDQGTAATAIIIAASANTVVKCGMVAALGSTFLRTRLVVATAVLLAAGALCLLFI
jgi:uncharacterized membrane protein (DUF4010 family)